MGSLECGLVAGPEDMLPTAEDGERQETTNRVAAATGWVQESSTGLLKHGSGQYPVLEIAQEPPQT